MNSSSPDVSRGDVLRKLREAQQIDIADLARQVNLSPAQILQLESGDLLSGERSYFYTSSIKDKAAIKVAKALGADPQQLWGDVVPVEPKSSSSGTDRKILNDLAELVQKQAQAQEMGATDRGFSWKWLMVGFTALWLAGAVGFYGQQVSEWFQSRQTQSIAVMTSANAQTMQTSLATQPSLIEPTPIDPAPSSSSLTEAPEALCNAQGSQTTLRPVQASKSGNTVHLVANSDVNLCVRDSLGKQTPLTLKAHESRTLLGKAPWSLRVANASPSNFHMYFQGQKLYWPEGEAHGVILKEVAGDF